MRKRVVYVTACACTHTPTEEGGKGRNTLMGKRRSHTHTCTHMYTPPTVAVGASPKTIQGLTNLKFGLQILFFKIKVAISLIR